jgi:hypothetical protein
VLPVALDPRDVVILAEAYELRPRQVIVDAAILDRWCWSNLELLLHLCQKYAWHGSMSVYYLAALRRALDRSRHSGLGWPPD